MLAEPSAVRALPILLLLSACGVDGAPIDDTLGFGDGKEDGRTGFVSAQSVQALWQRDDAADVVARSNPPFEVTFPDDALEAWEYLKPIGPTGMFGLLGPYGPLGINGPVGFRYSNPSTSIERVGAAIEAYASWLQAIADWYDQLKGFGDLSWRVWIAQLEDTCDRLHEWRFESKILSADGPLSAKGPLDPAKWTGRAFMDVLGMTDAPPNDMIEQLGPGGMLAPLGPVGPLSVLGPLGPLGPTTPLITFQGYQADDDGQFVSGLNGCYHAASSTESESHLCRTLLVPWTAQEAPCTTETANCRRYELYENYAEEFAKTTADNDTSFMVAGTTAEGASDVYKFRSHDAQFLTVTVVPEEKPLWDATALQGLLIAAGYVPGNPHFTRAMKYMPEAMETYPGVWDLSYDHTTAFDDFDLVVDVLDAQGRVTKTAKSEVHGHYNMPDWVQLKGPAGAKLRAQVKLAHRRHGIIGNPEVFTPAEARYRLFVTGATKHAPATVTSGPQFKTL